MSESDRWKDHIYDAVQEVETGGLKERNIRTKFRAAEAKVNGVKVKGSTAFGSMQLTSTYITDILDQHSSGKIDFTKDEVDFAKGLLEQAKLFNKHGNNGPINRDGKTNENPIPDSNADFDYGGKG